MRDGELVCPACGDALTTRNRSPDAWMFCESRGGVALRDAALRAKLGDGLVDRIWRRLVISDRRSERRCPQCRVAMAPLAIGDPADRVEVDVCRACRIVWFDPVELARVERVHMRSDEKTILLFLDWFGELHRPSRIRIEPPLDEPAP